MCINQTLETGVKQAPNPAQQFAIIVAGGSGTRMGASQPKQFLALNGRPVLAHTIERYLEVVPAQNLVLVLPQAHIAHYREHVHHLAFEGIKLVAGGETRTQSVRNGLAAIEAREGLVAIHDGVRPLVSKEIIQQSFELAALHGAAVAAVPAKDSLRMLTDGGNKAIERSLVRIIQTPQTFSLPLIRHTFEMGHHLETTDEATLAELIGHPITLFEGSYDNIKITTPEDLIIAESLLQRQRGL